MNKWEQEWEMGVKIIDKMPISQLILILFKHRAMPRTPPLLSGCRQGSGEKRSGARRTRRMSYRPCPIRCPLFSALPT